MPVGCAWVEIQKKVQRCKGKRELKSLSAGCENAAAQAGKVSAEKVYTIYTLVNLNSSAPTHVS